MNQLNLMSETPDYIDIEIWDDFIQHRKEIRHKLTATAKKYLLKKLAKFHENGIDVNLCLTQSIENGWQGVFEVETNRRQQTGNCRSETPVQRSQRKIKEALQDVGYA